MTKLQCNECGWTGNIDTKAPSQEVCEHCHRQGSLSNAVEPKTFNETTNGKCDVTFRRQNGDFIRCEREKGHKGVHTYYTPDDCKFSWMPKKNCKNKKEIHL